MKLEIIIAFVELLIFYGVVGLEETLDSATYVKLLKEEVLSLLHSKFGQLIVFQQDNA